MPALRLPEGKTPLPSAALRDLRPLLRGEEDRRDRLSPRLPVAGPRAAQRDVPRMGGVRASAGAGQDTALAGGDGGDVAARGRARAGDRWSGREPGRGRGRRIGRVTGGRAALVLLRVEWNLLSAFLHFPPDPAPDAVAAGNRRGAE